MGFAGKRFLRSPPPPPSFMFFLLLSQLSSEDREETLATQAMLEAISNTRDTFEHVECRKHGECEKNFTLVTMLKLSIR